MKMSILLVVLFSALFFACAQEESNPLLGEFNTPFQVPLFDKIKEGHFMPAFKEGMRLAEKEIDLIVNNSTAPTFENTIEALEKSGELLTQVNSVFNNLNSANTNDTLQNIAREVSPLLSKHTDDILMNHKLFERIKVVYAQKDQLSLTPEQNRVLEKYYLNFVRGGANLDETQKEQLRKINAELSLLSLQFGENVLKEDNNFKIVIENEADLAGLPERVVIGAAEAAKEQGLDGKWVFTLHKPSLIPFLQYSEKRDLREKMFKAYINRGDNNNEFDNKKILTRMANLRVEKAHLLGYPTHANFVLDEYMAKKPENVYGLLEKIWTPSLAKAKAEVQMLQEMIQQEGGNFKLAAWDWWFYAEKVKKAKYDLDETELRPYFQLENVRKGAFEVAKKLWGLQFEELTNIPKYHPDVKTFEVKEADGTHVGILYTDYYPRASKRGGAWMSDFRSQNKLNGKNTTPVITNVFNFSKPTGDTPALISFEEVLTLFHEFGHGLHGLLSNCTFPLLAGTNVAWDFVELPSQIMENWAADPEVLKTYAKHYQTGEPIPDELITKINNAKHFNQGFETVEFLAACILDMDWHTLADTTTMAANDFETQSMNRIGLIPEIVVRYRSPNFRHIFSGGYSSGYYAYIWAEVLDSDAFEAFKETNLYDQRLAAAFRQYILSAGGTEDPMVLYKKFRGAEPKIDGLLKKRGLM